MVKKCLTFAQKSVKITFTATKTRYPVRYRAFIPCIYDTRIKPCNATKLHESVSDAAYSI